jgi:multisubunit Na+/H+ antiporter MnhF subunit
VVALDGVLTTVALTIIANSARTDSTKYLVVAVVVALVAFVGTVIYARFIETTSG